MDTSFSSIGKDLAGLVKPVARSYADFGRDIGNAYNTGQFKGPSDEAALVKSGALPSVEISGHKGASTGAAVHGGVPIEKSSSPGRTPEPTHPGLVKGLENVAAAAGRGAYDEVTQHPLAVAGLAADVAGGFALGAAAAAMSPELALLGTAGVVGGAGALWIAQHEH